MSEGAFFQDLAVMMAVVGAVSLLFARLKWPKVIGWLLAGVLMGQYTWGGAFLANPESIGTLGQLGIVFLMFTLGLEFSVGEMRKVRHVTVPTAVFDLVVMIWLGYTVGRNLLGWDTVPSLFLGAAICDSATTLLAKTIEEMRWQDRPFVRYIFGTTIFEDILCVAVIALVTGVAGGSGMSFAAAARSMGGLAVFFTGVIVFGLVFVPRLLDRVAKSKDDEALLLVLLGCCFFVVYIAYRLDFSLALGAFLVGILGACSDARRRIYALVAPLRSMFAAMFFVTIGLLVDPAACCRNWVAILLLVAIVMLGKGFNCFFMSIACGQGVKDAVQTGFGLAQIGEFAYMVAMMYLTQAKEPDHPMYQIVVGVSLVTTCLNPVMLRLSDPVGDWCERSLPAVARGWLTAYREWLERLRRAAVPSALQKHMRARLAVLFTIILLNVGVFFAATWLNSLDYGGFSTFFNLHKRAFICFGVDVLLGCMVFPLLGVSRSLGRDMAMVLTGSRTLRSWRLAVQRVVEFATSTAVLAAAGAQMVLINLNLLPDEWQLRLALVLALVLAAVLGWKKFRRAGRAAGHRFSEALQAERRRAAAAPIPVATLSVPDDFYAVVAVEDGSAAIGRSIKELDVRARTGASIVSIVRQGVKTRNPGAEWRFAAGDAVSVIGERAQTAAFRELVRDR